MEISIQSIKFDATDRLKSYLEKKAQKLERITDDIQTVEYFLKVVKPEVAMNKEVEIVLLGLNSKLFASKVADTFEQAADECIEALEKQLKKLKEKQS